MKKSRGQVLVCFILLIPVILLTFALVIDLGLYGIEKRKIDNTVKDTVRYGLNNIDKSDVSNYIKALLIENIDDINDSNINIRVENNYVSIKVIKIYKAKFKISKDLEIESSFYGNIKDNKIEIKKEG